MAAIPVRSQITELSFGLITWTTYCAGIVSTELFAMNAWWLPGMFLAAAVATAAVEYGGLVSRFH
jgi:hypothetical protein